MNRLHRTLLISILTLAMLVTGTGLGTGLGANLDTAYADDETTTCTHDWQIKTQPATTSADGYTYKQCSKCETKDADYKGTTIAAIKSISVSKNRYAYDGKSHMPSLIVKDSNGKTIPASNYTIWYGNNSSYTSAKPSKVTAVGIYSYWVIFNGTNYSGNEVAYYAITPKKASVKSIYVGKNRITVKLPKKASAYAGQRYRIAYALYSPSKKKLTYHYVYTKSTKRTIKGLKKGRRYVVAVSTCKTCNSIEIQSDWSTAKLSAKVK